MVTIKIEDEDYEVMDISHPDFIGDNYRVLKKVDDRSPFTKWAKLIQDNCYLPADMDRSLCPYSARLGAKWLREEICNALGRGDRFIEAKNIREIADTLIGNKNK